MVPYLITLKSNLIIGKYKHLSLIGFLVMSKHLHIETQIFFIVSTLFKGYYFERERESTHASGGGAERERGRERIPSRLRAVSREPDVGLDPVNCEIMT